MEFFIRRPLVANRTAKDGVLSGFGAPKKVNDQGVVHSDKKFVEMKTYSSVITIPKGYIHSAQLEHHPTKSFLGTGNYIDPLAFRAALTEPTNRLTPDEKYEVRFFALAGRTTSLEALKFLAALRSLRVGIQGLSIVYALCGRKFPNDRWVIAFDDRGHLFADDNGSFRVPMILQPLGHASSLSLGHFGEAWHNKHIIISVVQVG